jgi:mono/diheme cytochrome c family protein
MSLDCNSCHGGGGGGGMAAPLTNPVWIYGDDDDTLFRLIEVGPFSETVWRLG